MRGGPCQLAAVPPGNDRDRHAPDGASVLPSGYSFERRVPTAVQSARPLNPGPFASMPSPRLSARGGGPLGAEWRRRRGVRSGPNGSSSVRRAGGSWQGALSPEPARQPHRHGCPPLLPDRQSASLCAALGRSHTYLVMPTRSGPGTDPRAGSTAPRRSRQPVGMWLSIKRCTPSCCYVGRRRTRSRPRTGSVRTAWRSSLRSCSRTRTRRGVRCRRSRRRGLAR